jgi:hemolysin activation/secretion protein
VVYLEVLEGKIEEFRITGSRYFSLDRIRDEVPALAEGNVLYLPEVQEQLAQVNNATQDRSVTPVLRPGRTPGTVEVELKVADELPLHGNVEVNDRHTQNTTRLRASGRIQYDNLWQRAHSLALDYQTSPEDTDEVQVVAGTYLWRFASSNNILVFYGLASDSETASVGTLAVIGKGVIGGTRFILPLNPGNSYFHSMSLGLDYKDFDEDVALEGGGSVKTPIDYVNWAIQYNGTLRDQGALWKFGFSTNFGVRGLANDPEEFEDKRVKAEPNYFYVRGDITYNSPNFFRSTAKVKLAGQVADSPLASNEQFSAGGADTVRGYFESQALGDNAIMANLEWYSPPVMSMPELNNDWRFLLFLDGAFLRVKNPLPSQQDTFELAGAGIGMRMTARNSFTADLDFARPFHNNVNIDENQVRIHFKLQYSF